MSNAIFDDIKSKSDPLIERIQLIFDVHELYILHDQLIEFVEDIQCQIMHKEVKLNEQEKYQGFAQKEQEFDSWRSLAMRYRQKAMARQRECKTRIRKLEAESHVGVREQIKQMQIQIEELQAKVALLSNVADKLVQASVVG